MLFVSASLCWFWTAKDTEIIAINYHLDEWHLESRRRGVRVYSNADLLFHNDLFILIKFMGNKKNKLLVLFKDQLSQDELTILCRQLLIE